MYLEGLWSEQMESGREGVAGIAAFRQKSTQQMRKSFQKENEVQTMRRNAYRSLKETGKLRRSIAGKQLEQQRWRELTGKRNMGAKPAGSQTLERPLDAGNVLQRQKSPESKNVRNSGDNDRKVKLDLFLRLRL